jgi:signal transduction histidine kinase
MTGKSFELVLKEQAAGYADEIRRVLKASVGLERVDVSIGEVAKSLHIASDFITSISFVGMVTGEFIMAISEKNARSFFKNVLDEEEICDSLSESLNMVAGSRIGELSAIFQKLTITPPRLIRGQIQYRNVKNIQIHIETEKGSLSAYFFIDLMSLDVANSYRSIFQGLKQANEKLSDANQKLIEQQTQLIQSEKMASLGMIAAGVAHEINNPLAFVLSNANVLNDYVDVMRLVLMGHDQLLSVYATGNAERIQEEHKRLSLLRESEDIDYILEDTKKLLADSKFGLERIRGIVAGLKRFSRVDDSGLKIVNPNEEIQNALMLLQNELKYKCKLKPDLQAKHEIECFPSEINQVIVNLIVNAAQAMKTSEGVLEISTEDANDGINIRIKDNGVGISPDNMKKLFSPFFTTKPAGEGTGLGLAISQGIIHKHHGKLTVRSALGEGSEFTIWLPYQYKPTESATEVRSGAF